MGSMVPLRHLVPKVHGASPDATERSLAFRHMTASDLNTARQIISCQAGAIHT
jgi:hypothetical protein